MLEPILERFRAIALSLGEEREMPQVAPHGGGFHAEFDGVKFHYVFTHDSCCGDDVDERESTKDPEELLRWAVRDLTYDLAHSWAEQRYDERIDHRRLWFTKHVELLRSIDSSWADIQQRKYDAILKTSPYDDAERDRIDYMRELQSKEGMTLGEAYRKAEQKFPEPRNAG